VRAGDALLLGLISPRSVSSRSLARLIDGFELVSMGGAAAMVVLHLISMSPGSHGRHLSSILANTDCLRYADRR
jgi:hypothetical protein